MLDLFRGQRFTLVCVCPILRLTGQLFCTGVCLSCFVLDLFRGQRFTLVCVCPVLCLTGQRFTLVCVCPVLCLTCSVVSVLHQCVFVLFCAWLVPWSAFYIDVCVFLLALPWGLAGDLFLSFFLGGGDIYLQWKSFTFLGRNFIAQSITIRAWWLSRFWRRSILDWSWLMVRMIWRFHSLIWSTADATLNIISSLFLMSFSRAALKKFSISMKRSQQAQLMSCAWSHTSWNSGLLLSLKSHEIQWSAHWFLLETWSL